MRHLLSCMLLAVSAGCVAQSAARNTEDCRDDAIKVLSVSAAVPPALTLAPQLLPESPYGAEPVANAGEVDETFLVTAPSTRADEQGGTEGPPTPPLQPAQYVEPWRPEKPSVCYGTNCQQPQQNSTGYSYGRRFRVFRLFR